jgi:hypothetical protein
MNEVFTKRYADRAALEAAERHYHWLAEYIGVLRLPRLLGSDGSELLFEFTAGRIAGPADLAELAEHLGDVHSTAMAGPLATVDLVSRPTSPLKTVFARPYFTTRAAVLLERYREGYVGTRRELARLGWALERSAQLPAAFYKDANCRNFIIQESAAMPVTVDFDDLDLAPMGYDLAKLVVSLHMTYGPMPASTIHTALDGYNRATQTHVPETAPLSIDQFGDLVALQITLNAPYLGCHDYIHPADKLMTETEPR